MAPGSLTPLAHVRPDPCSFRGDLRFYSGSVGNTATKVVKNSGASNYYRKNISKKTPPAHPVSAAEPAVIPAVVEILNSDHFYIFGKFAEPYLNLPHLLRTRLGYSAGIVGELLLINARDRL